MVFLREYKQVSSKAKVKQQKPLDKQDTKIMRDFGENKKNETIHYNHMKQTKTGKTCRDNFHACSFSGYVTENYLK
jgi:hypothetical protein